MPDRGYKSMICACGNKADKIKWSRPVCARCDWIERNVLEDKSGRVHNGIVGFRIQGSVDMEVCTRKP